MKGAKTGTSFVSGSVIGTNTLLHLIPGPAGPKWFQAAVVQSPLDPPGWAALVGRESLLPELPGTQVISIFCLDICKGI